MNVTLKDEIREQHARILRKYDQSLLFGLGVNDPKGVFGTTLDLWREFGVDRVFETPTSENAITGFATGLSIAGSFPMMVHQRQDFFILALDQLVNSAAKWGFMHGDQLKTPMLIRLISGRGWGQGPTHSQNLHSWFTHIPRLNVSSPVFPSDAEYVMQSAVNSNFPTIMLEDRWCHDVKTNSSSLFSRKDVKEVQTLRRGSDLTIITFGFGTLIGIRALDFLAGENIEIGHVRLLSLKPLNWELIMSAIEKTDAILVIDTGFHFSSYSSFLAHNLSNRYFSNLKHGCHTLDEGDYFEPTSHGVIADYKLSASKIVRKICEIIGASLPSNYKDIDPLPSDQPDPSFRGPF